ncbi:ABC transporter family substrate-binding protein [Streptomyces sp. PKU-MA01144]|uniref:ABC transporter family substrate-binding protein n=1 Tax=Streptomyces sp. PKU-MA01144 TaxID=2729138 RepID=UPI00147C320E|nr:ABC transporter family substrate-binding protein [Streptomyces sp. PKU-MA01144]NNJ04386.1 ABC transporter family substrate-binding protein [Streptomyces sp. PKU-MA01144]
MSEVDAPRGRACSRTPRLRTPGDRSGRTLPGRTRTLRSVALLTSGVLVLPVLAGCTSGEDGSGAVAVPSDIGHTGRDRIEKGGTLRWAVDSAPTTLNAFQADANSATGRVTGAVLPSLFTLDQRGRPQLNPDYLESAELVDREPKQVVLYKLNQEAVWTDGREIGAPDFVAQWRALSGKDTAYWTARNAGYERIEKIERGKSDLEVRVTFARPYADWRSLFSPLYPKETMGTPASFNDGARSELPVTAGPFALQKLDGEEGTVTLVRNPRWWGDPAKLDSIVLRAVPRDRRAAALATGDVDIAEIDRGVADRIAVAHKDPEGGSGGSGPGAASATAGESGGGSEQERSAGAAGAAGETADGGGPPARGRGDAGPTRFSSEQTGLRGFVVRKSLEPAYTQLALNGESGPLADERVRRAVARALDRRALAETVLKPLGLPAKPVGSHLALAGQPAYADSSGALGGQDTEEAQALLADAGWTPEGARAADSGTKAGPEQSPAAGSPAAQSPAAQSPAAGSPAQEGGPAAQSPAAQGPSAPSPGVRGPSAAGAPAPGAPESPPAAGAAGAGSADGAAAPGGGGDDKPGARGPVALPGGSDGDKAMPEAYGREGGVAGAYAPVGTRAPGRNPVAGPLGKDGQPLSLRFVLPSGPGSEPLRTVADRIRAMLDRIGISTEVKKVADESFFKDHIASGHYDLALWSWPATAYPATDARPIYAKPQPATDGSLLVEQNYTRVGTDRIDQLFDEAVSELDERKARDLMKQVDSRIWAAAASIPLYQRPELVAAKHDLANAGAFGFSAPRYQDIGFVKAGPAHGAERN